MSSAVPAESKAAPSAGPGRARPVVFLVSHSSAGGVQAVWADLADAFRDKGDRTDLVALYPGRDPSDANWRCLVPKRPGSPLDVARMFMALVRYLRTEAPGCVFTAMPAANVIVPVAAKLAGRRTKIFLSHHSPSTTHNRLLDLIDGLSGSLREVAGVVSVSQAVHQSLSSKPHRYIAKRRTISNALPPRIESYIRRLAAERLTKRRGRVVVAMGRLSAEKNLPLLLRASAHMPDVTVHLIGGGPDEAVLRALAVELGVAKRVLFLGAQSRSDALSLLSQGDVFVQPSFFEGHSLALLEAAKLGMPLVVSNAPGQVEGITNRAGQLSGVSVGTDDERSLAEAILLLLNDPDAHQTYAHRAALLGAESDFGDMVDAYRALAQ